GQRGSVVLTSMVVETVVPAASGASAATITWITMSRPRSARRVPEARPVPLAAYGLRDGRTTAFPTGLAKPSGRARPPLAFASGPGKMPPASRGAGEDDGPAGSTTTRNGSPRSGRGALPQLRAQRHHVARASRLSRRAEARPAPDPLRHVPEPPPDGGGPASQV